MSDDLAADGMAHQQAGRLDEAVAAYRRAIEQSHARLAAIEFNLGIVLLQQGQVAEAIAAAEQACAMGGGAMAEELRGAALINAGRGDDADVAFARAAELAPERAGPWYNRGLVARQRGDTDAAIAHYREGLRRVPDHLPCLEVLGSLLHYERRIDEAVAIHEHILRLDPTHITALHLLAAARGELPSAPPPGFVAATFDSYAPTFERHLRDDLAYRGPEELRAALGDERAGRALDLGCGTGLVGAALRDLVDHLDGLDVSPRMIEEARKKGLYDALAVGDAVELLDAGGPPYDLVVAAEVLVYIGDVAPLFAAVRRRLAPGGRFAFTVEGDDTDGWRLELSGRYAHGRAHIEALAARSHLTIAHCAPVSLRTEAGVPLVGLLFVLRA